MTSCGGTSRATVRRLTRTIRSIGANTRITPGPFGRGNNFPNRKMTPRSYSARILIELITYSTTMTTRISGGNTIVAPQSDRSVFANRQHQSVNARDTDAVALSEHLRRDRGPDLAVCGHASTPARIDDRQCPANVANHAGGGGDLRQALRRHRQPDEKDGDSRQTEHDGQHEP